MHIWIIALVIAYLLGSIPFGYLLVLVFRKEDIRATGSGNIGATNVARSGAKGLGALTLFLDALKGFLAVVIARHLAQQLTSPQDYKLVALAGVVVVIGHIFPVWLGFRGGKGVAAALGVFLAWAPLSALIAVAVFLAIVFLTKYVSVASLLAGYVFVVIAIATDNKHLLFVDLCYVAIPVIVTLKHHGNIRRLMAGTENRFGSKA
ncbi:glycerol-3-phosphate 1-O-acyltransferase PlsY [Terriglobus saanensis]|uniref:Glycerol-3-phosphate acyltransferase n=1 Tax=Terriglobus saanensis (strain ATCC BAA-1853 / DSM 23119 / SP1PR4) TaxID=401053 RepID=E8V6U3_TERSS|nr:glycerol-3-phosphate 1-O-acyltransferase PlsY [Terriglobus saanensis]ADV83895.1 protein of unknown function DUF205 [Terriglobus saanensis SP1PR4]